MTALRLEIDLEKIRHNASTLVKRLRLRGISVTGVTKATLGSPEIAGVLLQAGVRAIGDSRIENIETLRNAGILAPMTLIRSPMISQVERVVAHADVSFNTELEVIGKLSDAAYGSGRTHGIVLMVELGDLREGIMPEDLLGTVRETLRCRNIVLKGIGTNLACRSGVSPDAVNMAKLSALAESIDAAFGVTLDIVSGGNSSNLQWAFSAAGTGRINDLRLGESILLGVEPLHRQPIHGLYTDAITLVAAVLESKVKPSQPWGDIGQTAFGAKPAVKDRGFVSQAILAVGHQDTDPEGLTASSGFEIVGASSDHLILYLGKNKATVGSEITFQPNYSALVRAMTSPFVAKILKPRTHNADANQGKRKQAVL